MILKVYFLRATYVAAALLLWALTGCGAGRTPVRPLPRVTAATGMPAAAVDSMDSSRPTLRREVAILFNDAPGYAEVAAQLTKLLPSETYRLTLADVEADNSRGLLSALRAKPGLFVVAIGLPAARIARDQLNAPIVFAQVFNHQELLVPGRAIRGITAMPPLDLLVQDWKKLDPKLQRLGLIASERHSSLFAEAELAAQATAITIKRSISDSDRETLYLFKRLAPQIDGLLLFPDDRILSPTVLRELLSYAVSHGVRVCVFSDALLSWGALLSASPTPENIALTVRRVLDEVMAGNTDTVPPLTPLSELGLRINEDVAGRLGLSPQPRAAWIVGGER